MNSILSLAPRLKLSANSSTTHLLVKDQNLSVHHQTQMNTFRRVSMEQLRNILNDMTIKTSHEDPLPAPLVKTSIEVLLPYLHDLVNLSLETGNISVLKESAITPIYQEV